MGEINSWMNIYRRTEDLTKGSNWGKECLCLHCAMIKWSDTCGWREITTPWLSQVHGQHHVGFSMPLLRSKLKETVFFLAQQNWEFSSLGLEGVESVTTPGNFLVMGFWANHLSLSVKWGSECFWFPLWNQKAMTIFWEDQGETDLNFYQGRALYPYLFCLSRDERNPKLGKGFCKEGKQS